MATKTHVITDDTLSGDLTGSVLSPSLSTTGVTAGSYTNANISVDAKGRVTAASTGSGGATVSDATTTSKGIVQLAGDLAGTAAAPTVPGLATKEPAVTAGTTSQYYRGDKTFQTLNKAAVGLANVDNTADTAKPVSTAQQTALDAKQATLVSGTNIKTINGSTVLGSGDLVISGGSAPSDATTTAKGIIQLAGDLTGTAASPALAATAVTAGTYTNTNLTVDAKGRITAASNGTAGGGGSASDATTTSKGIVQLAGDLGGTAASPQVVIGTARDTNLIANPSFEVDYASWTPYGVYGTITRDNTTAFSGTYSSKHTNTTGSDGGLLSAAFSLSPGNYTFSVYAKLTSDVVNACMVLRGSGSTTGVSVQINQAYPGNTNFNRYTGNFTITAQGGTYEVLLGQGSYGSASTGTVNFDSVMVTAANANQTYFDGSLTSTATTTYSWTGTAHNSQSVRVAPSRLVNSDNLLEGTTNQFFTTDRASKTASSVLAFWDGTVNPTVTGQSYPLATLGGVATYIDGSGVRLTPNTGNQAGQIYWDFVQAPFMRVQFNFMVAPDPGGADATWFYCFANANPTTEYGAGGFTKGYVVYISEYSGRIGLAYGNFDDGTQNQSGMGAALKPLFSTTLPASQIVNGQFNNVDVTIRYNRIVVRYNGTIMIDYTDVYTRDLTNTKFGFGSRTGGSTNNHYIKGLVVAKLGQDLNEYGIQSRIDDTTKTYVDTADALRVLDLADVAVSTAGTLVAGKNSGVTASGTYTAPAPAATVGTPPQRFAITNRTTGSVTLSMPNPAGTTLSLTILPGEVTTFRQVTTSGYINESGNKPLAQLDARYQGLLTLTTTGTSGAATLSGNTLNIPQYAGGSGGSGITRSITSGSTNTTLGAAALTDYVYICTGSSAYTITLPTAVSNTNRYTVKNGSTVTQTIATTSSQTIDGSSTITIKAGDAYEFISDNTNWRAL